MFLNILFYIFIVSIFIQFLYYFLIFRKFVFYIPSSKKPADFKPVSVIICAKNEEKNLEQFLPEIYQQDYPDFEVVLIDDRSIDRTWDIMDTFKQKYPKNTKVVRVDFSNNPRFVGNKKYALTLGIKAATHPNLLFTDADCKPVSKYWISQMMSKMQTPKQLILGYGKYQTKPGFLNKLIRYETLQTGLQYFSYALIGKAYMGVGRNLAYTKDLFFGNNGFYNHMDVLSGDDDLFVNEVATDENTDICIHPNSFTESIPKENFGEWIFQKRRHISTARYYKFIHKILLGLYHFSLQLFYLSAIVLLIRNYHWKIVVFLVLLRFVFWYIINFNVAKKLQEKGIVWWLIFLEPFLMLFQIYIYVYNLFKKPKLWKTSIN